MKKIYYLVAWLLLAAMHPLTAQNYQQVQKLTGSKGIKSIFPGSPVTINSKYAAISSRHSSTEGNSVYVFEKDLNGKWIEKQILKSSNSNPGDKGTFGASLDIYENKLVVGATGGHAIYVFERFTSGWKQTARLEPSDPPASWDDFGTSVSIYGETIVVSSQDLVTKNNAKVYIFEKNEENWHETNIFSFSEVPSLYGLPVSLFKNRIAVGTSGTVYILEKENGLWKKVDAIVSPSTDKFTQFGLHISLFGDEILIGDDSDTNEAGEYVGAAFIYEKTLQGWRKIQKLIPDKNSDKFGFSVSLYDNELAIGAYLYDGSYDNEGGVYVYEKIPNGIWQQKQILTQKDHPEGEFFGITLDFFDSQLMVASSSGYIDGTAYIFGSTENPSQQSIARFSLINAKTDQVIPAYADLQEGSVINLSNTGLTGDDKYSQLNLEAITNPATVGSVKFILKGPVSTAPVENGAPYAIFSDSNGNYDGGSLPVGSYTLTAIPYSEAKKGGVEGEGKTIHFSVVDGPVEEPTPPEEPGNDNNTLAIARFSLINAKTDEAIPAYANLQEGAVINLSNTGLTGDDKYSQLNLEAVTNPTTVGSVKFILKGPASLAPVDNSVPYAIFGGYRGDYKAGSLPVGSYTLTAIPFSEAKRSGTEGTRKTIHFTVVDQAEEPSQPEDPDNDALAVTRFSLINAKTDQVIPAYANLQEGAVINLSNTSLNGSDKYSQLNIEAITNPATVGSVKFILRGPVSTAPVEGGAPYAIFGDNNGNYDGGSLPVGSYTLTAIPYSEAKKGGVEGTRKTIHFSVVDGQAARVTPTAKAKTAAGAEQQAAWGREVPQVFHLYPNPATDKLHLAYRGESGEGLLLSVYNAAGQLIRQKTAVSVLEEEIDVSEQPPGIYMAVLLHQGEQITQKFIVTR